MGPGKRPELALRFDLTVPLARYVAEHEHELNFPFRRYQIQRVYRGERNQKGRYREFYQCDIDVIGKDQLPLAYDAEIPAVIHGIFRELGFGQFQICINNRKLLRGVLESLDIVEARHDAVLHEIDRLGKQPRDEIEARLASEAFGLDPGRVKQLFDLMSENGEGSRGTLEALRKLEHPSLLLVDGLDELQRVYDGTLALDVPEQDLKISLSIARGLDYYTGTVYETFLVQHPEIGSICSGGRYDNLAEHYTKSKLPGVGISIGATRLFWHVMQKGLFKETPASTAQVLMLSLGSEFEERRQRMASQLRANHINVDVYGGEAPLKKQLKYADRGRIPLAIFYGTNEAQRGVVRIKVLQQEHFDMNEHCEPEFREDGAELVGKVQQLLRRLKSELG